MTLQILLDKYDFLVGGNGLVGYVSKNISKKKIKYLNIQRQNQSLLKGKKCDLLIYANGNANKTLAEKNPEYDFEKIPYNQYSFI